MRLTATYLNGKTYIATLNGNIEFFTYAGSKQQGLIVSTVKDEIVKRVAVTPIEFKSILIELNED